MMKMMLRFPGITQWSGYFTARQLQVSGYNCLRRLSTMSQTVPPILSVLPTRALVDEKFKVEVENLPPGSPVTLHSLHLSEDNHYWEAFGHYVSDHRGTVSAAEDLSFGGTYTGREPMGLLWSMRPVPGSRQGLRLRKTNVCTPMLIDVSVYGGHVAEGFREQAPLASVLTERWYMAPGVKRISIKEKGVRGTLFIPPGPGPFPGLVDMWGGGGGGGLLEYRSALLASHGFVSLGLEYLTQSTLGTTIQDLKLNYFEAAFNIVKDYPQVIPDKVGIFGLSLGSILAIYSTATSTIIKVGQINCPMLLVNGLDDQNWPTVEATEDMTKMMCAAGKEHLLTKLHYPDAGHLIEPPYSPHFRATTFITDKSKVKDKVILLWGGRTKPHSDAQEDSWKKILSFLKHHLYCSSTPNSND